jgi:hypothetical protein
MAETKRIATDQLTRYFDAFSKRFLMADAVERADVEILDDRGDQALASGVKLLGVDYDPHTNALELELESGDHRRSTRVRCGRWKNRTDSSAHCRSCVMTARARS